MGLVGGQAGEEVDGAARVLLLVLLEVVLGVGGLARAAGPGDVEDLVLLGRVRRMSELATVGDQLLEETGLVGRVMPARGVGDGDGEAAVRPTFYVCIGVDPI